MDQHGQRGRSPSGGHHQPHISQGPGAYQPNDGSAGLGLSMDQSGHLGAFNDPNNNFLGSQQQQAAYAQQNMHDPGLFDSVNSFSHPQMGASGPNPGLSFNSQQSEYLSPNMDDGDFSLFPASGGPGDNYNTPLFEQPTLNPNDINNMTSPQSHNSPTPPHALQLDNHQQPGSAQHSPSFNQHQFSPTAVGHHSRNVSLGPEAALLSGQDWSQPQFQRHRRSPSAHSDVSSVSPSPNLVTSDSFDADLGGHSPLQRASDGGLYQDVLNIGNFSISDPAIGSPGHQGRSPSHSPAISPRIGPQQMPDLNQQQFGLPPGVGPFGGPPGYPSVQVTNDPFPNLQAGGGSDVSQMAPPSINIDYAPSNNAMGKLQIDEDSLTPPERGMYMPRTWTVINRRDANGIAQVVRDRGSAP